MKVPYNWLKEYVDLPVNAVELGRRFTLAGLEIDEVEELFAEIQGVVVAKVLTCAPLEGSDHLSLCSVDDGATHWTVLCGAPNVAAGQTVALARIGAELLGGFKISKRKMQGVESQGMICSRRELGLDSDHSGIWLLPEGLTLGQDVFEALSLRDSVLVLELTPNRSDCLGLLNCAHEAAALCNSKFHGPEISYPENGPQITEIMQIEVADAALCPRYVGRLVQGVKIGPSPLWLQSALTAAGMRPINNVVDISNYVMLEMNQPLHTFDYQQLKGRKIVVREARPGEKMQTLDGKERTFTGDEIMICDAERTICIGGVMGGMDTEVTEATTDVLIEAACFDPVRIRRAARRHGIPSEASQRFEKGIDVSNCDRAAQRAAQLLVELCGGTAAQGVIDVGGQTEYPRAQVTLRAARTNALLGTDYSMAEIKAVMQALDFTLVAEDAHSLTLAIPSYRQDITLEEDLIEEVARLMGYDTIPVTMPASSAQGRRTPEQQLVERVRELAVAHGLAETVNYSFISSKEAERLALPENHPWRNALAIANPLNEEQGVMRRSLLPGLLQNARRNISRRNLDIALFEERQVFLPQGDNPAEQQPQEVLHLGVLLAGSAPADWQQKGRAYDYFYLKGLLESITAALGVYGLAYRKPDLALYPFLHPGRSAEIWLKDEKLGVLGELHPQTAERYELPEGVQVAELALQPLFTAARPERLLELPKYPASRRDLALVGSAEIPAAEIAAVLRTAGSPLLQELSLFDLYAGEGIPAGQRSLAFALLFRDAQRTLTDAEVDAAVANILAALPAEWGLKLR